MQTIMIRGRLYISQSLQIRPRKLGLGIGSAFKELSLKEENSVDYCYFTLCFWQILDSRSDIN